MTTNYERIRTMTIEEMAEFLRAVYYGTDPWCNEQCDSEWFSTCPICIKEYLESESEVEE